MDDFNTVMAIKRMQELLEEFKKVNDKNKNELKIRIFSSMNFLGLMQKSYVEYIASLSEVYKKINHNENTQFISLENTTPDESIAYLRKIGAFIVYVNNQYQFTILPHKKEFVRQSLEKKISDITELMQNYLEVKTISYLKELAQALAGYKPEVFGSLPSILEKVILGLKEIKSGNASQVDVEKDTIAALEKILPQDNSVISNFLIELLDVASLEQAQLSNTSFFRQKALGVERAFEFIINSNRRFLNVGFLIPETLQPIVQKGITLYDEIDAFRRTIRETGCESTPNGALVFVTSSPVNKKSR
jgi:hypothetical protein